MTRRAGRQRRWQRRMRRRALVRQLARRLGYLRDRHLVHGLGIGTKVRAGRDTGHIGAVAYVANKANPLRHQRVPRRIRVRIAALGRSEHLLTDVVEAPAIGEACAIASGDYLLAADVATCALAWHAGQNYLLTCAHVCFTPSAPDDPNRGTGIQIYDFNQHIHLRAGWVDEWSGIETTAVNVKDDARAALLPGQAVDHLRAGPGREPVVQVRDFDVGSSGQYLYFSPRGEHRCSHPVARAPGDTLQVNIATPGGIVATQYGSFYMLAMAAGYTVQPGDSGAAIYRRVPGGLEWAGILFGRLGPTIALAFSAPSIARRHGVPLP